MFGGRIGGIEIFVMVAIVVVPLYLIGRLMVAVIRKLEK
jgi:hypothetical protein